MSMELEWRLQVMTKVGNAIMENGGTGEWQKLLEETNEGWRKGWGRRVLKGETFFGRLAADSSEAEARS